MIDDQPEPTYFFYRPNKSVPWDDLMYETAPINIFCTASGKRTQVLFIQIIHNLISQKGKGSSYNSLIVKGFSFGNV